MSLHEVDKGNDFILKAFASELHSVALKDPLEVVHFICAFSFNTDPLRVVHASYMQEGIHAAFDHLIHLCDFAVANRALRLKDEGN